MECLRNFRAVLIDIALSLEQLFIQLNTNSKKIKKLLSDPKNQEVLWASKDAEKHVQMIIFLAGIVDPQFLQFESFLNTSN